MELPQETCPSCGCSAPKRIGRLPDVHWFSGQRFTETDTICFLYRCTNCYLKFRYPVRSSAEYAELYNNRSTGTWSDFNRPDWNLIIRYLSDRRWNQARILDFGCYTGGLLARLGTPHDLYGVEINRAAAAVARKHARIWHSIDEIPSDSKFEIIIAADVVEHLVNPAALISRLAGLLTDDGILIITTGDADVPLWNRYGTNWWYCFFPEHVAFISYKWLAWFTETTGIRLLCCEHFRYVNHGVARRQMVRLAVRLYGRLGARFLLFLRVLRRILQRAEIKSIPGAGAVCDHLFIVLSRKVIA